MALFKRDFNKPGPGVPKNAPKKKGIPRFFEVIGRDISNLIRLNLWYLLCIAPALVLFAIALFSFFGGALPYFMVFALLALGASVLVGPATTATYTLITRMLRDDPGFVSHDFKKLFKDNFRGTALPGVIYSVLLGSQAVAFIYYFLLSGALNVVMVVLYLFSVLIFSMAAPYFFLQAGYLDLNTSGIVKNSLLFALGYLPRTLAGMVISFVLGAGVLVLAFIFPPAVLVPLLLGFAVNNLIRTMWYWPQVDKTFEIDKTLKKRNADALDERMEEIGEHDKIVGKREQD